MLLRKYKFNLFVLFLMITILLLISASEASMQKQALGELKIEGKYIEKLVLCNRDGRTEQFNEPNETIKLAVGEYRLQDVRLKDGYTCDNLHSSTINWIMVTENKPAVLEVGAPLKQMVTIDRQGIILKLNYKLTGVGGETYAITRIASPAFTIFKGDKKVAADMFEFG